MGGAAATGALQMGYLTQTWLAVSNDAAGVMRYPSLPADSQVRGLTEHSLVGGSRDRTRTYNLPVNRRPVIAGITDA
jgi:hypothetical protein